MNKQAIIQFSPPQSGLMGNVTIRCFRDGLLCKYADLTAQEEGITDEGMFATGIRLIITLQGSSELCFEQNRLTLCAEKRALAALLPIAKPVHGVKQFTRHQRQRELVIFLEPQWIEHSGFVKLTDYRALFALQQIHLQPFMLFVNKRILTLAESLLQDLAQDSAVMQIRKESECLMLIAELLAQLPHFKQQVAFSAEQIRVAELTKMPQSGDWEQASLSQIAHAMHTNVTTLQKQFKQIHGVSIMAYLRQVKLERAYEALLLGASVNHAAEIAGYGNPDNFTTAFRHYFDIVPSQVKKSRLLPFIG